MSSRVSPFFLLVISAQTVRPMDFAAENNFSRAALSKGGATKILAKQKMPPFSNACTGISSG